MVEVRHTAPSDTFSLLGGYNFAVSLDQSHGSSDPIPLGFLFKARHELVNARFWKSPGLRPLGIEFALNSSHLDYKNAPFIYSELFAGFLLYYQVRLTRGWSIMPRMGLGVATLWVTQDGLFGEPLQGDTGVSFAAGGSLQKIWSSGFLMEGGVDFRLSSYTGGYFFSLFPWLAGGFRF